MSVKTKCCTSCGEAKPATPEFFFKRDTKSLRGECKTCVQAARRKGGRLHEAHTKRDAEKRSAYKHQYRRVVERFTTYGVTQTDYLIVREFQDHRCALCRETLPEKDCVDHCHTTQRVRGILCQLCNTTFERENYSTSKQSTVKRYLSIPHVWDVALAVRSSA